MKCDYNCGNNALFVLKNGKQCCVENWNKCPEIKRNKSINLKKSYQTGSKLPPKSMTGINPWNKGLTKETNSKLMEQSIKLSGRRVGSFVKHTEETKERIAQSMRGNNNGKHRGDRQSYYQNIRMDSSWEVKVAEYLDQNNIKWKYSQTVFNIDDKRSYRPDFELDNGNFIEVKGYWRKENLDKFNDFKKKFPDIVVDIWDKIKLKELKIL